MRTFHVKKGEEAGVIAGADKGKRGRIITIVGKKQRVIIEGVHMIKKHMRKSQQYPQGQIVEREGSVHISNVVKAEEYDARVARRGTAAPAQA